MFSCNIFILTKLAKSNTELTIMVRFLMEDADIAQFEKFFLRFLYKLASVIYHKMSINFTFLVSKKA